MLGFVIPLANAIIQSANLADMVMWGIIALVVQLIVYGIVTRVIPGITARHPAGQGRARRFSRRAVGLHGHPECGVHYVLRSVTSDE